MTRFDPRRRHALCCGGALAAGLFSTLVSPPAPAQTLREGVFNPCLGELPPALARHELVQAAFEGLDARRLVDVHAHLLGTGDSGSGCTVSAEMDDWWRPTEFARRRLILDAACVPKDAPSVDRAYVQRLAALAAAFPTGARWWLFAFDQARDDQGRVQPAQTTFHVPDDYAARVAAAHPERFDWVASIHPYREDALERLQAARAAGARAVKWLPSAMNIDPADRRSRRFYDALADSGLPLIVHCGEERAVPGARRDAFGNPLQVRHPLGHGVRVVMAHAGSLGHAPDTDRRSAPEVPAFELFARLMDEPAARGLLLADISAAFQDNRRPEVWRTLLARADWHERLLHGSDYPLPGLMPLYAPRALVRAGLLAEEAVEPLRAIRRHNPLLFHFVLERSLRLGSQALPASVFEGRALFTPARGAAAAPAATVPAGRTTTPDDRGRS